jgi:hypothetical protein
MFYKYCKHHDIDTIDYPEKFYIETSFTKIKGVKYGPYKHIRCIECKRGFWNKWALRNLEKEKARHRIDALTPEQIQRQNKKSAEYRKNNKASARIFHRVYDKERKKVDVGYRILRNIRTRLWQALKKLKKSDSTMKLTGCTLEQLKKHIESKFKDRMSWDNYGVWHVDHIIPCAQFDLSDPEQQRICFHYTNLQPMWGEDNLKKGARLNG